MALPVVVPVVAVVGIGRVILVPVRILLHLGGAGGAQLENLLLEGPSVAAVVGRSGGYRFVDVLGAVVEIALQIVPRAGDEREVGRLHALDRRIGDLVASLVAVA